MLFLQNGGQCDWAYVKVNEVGGPGIPGLAILISNILT